MIYAGIGARKTPMVVLDQMHMLGRFLAQRGHVLRSGGAVGADRAFEMGAASVSGPREIFTTNTMTREQFGRWSEHAEKYHPAWDKCDDGIKQLHARNSAIILGEMLDTPVDFVITWTADGQASGGTGQGLRIAEAWNCAIFNLFYVEHVALMWQWFKREGVV